MGSETQVFKLDLDNAEFLDKALSARLSIQKIGDAENLTGLIEGLTKVGIAVGVVGAALYAMKSAIDLSVEAEHIEQVNRQFEMLTENAGIAANELKAGLEKTSGGLIDNTTLLQAANRAIVEMGGSAKRLPDVMDLARKATAVFGGTLVDNFNNLNQALATGQTRMLKHYGIVVDNTAATRKYAEELGVAESELSEAGKRQAIFNAALEQGQEQFKGVDTSLTQTKNYLDQIKATITEVKDAFVIAFEKTMGPTVHKFLGGLKAYADDLKTMMVDKFGSGAEQAQAHLQRVQTKIFELKDEIKATSEMANTHPLIGTEALNHKKKLEALHQELLQYQIELGRTSKEVGKLADAEKKRDAATTAKAKPKTGMGGEAGVDYVKKEQNEAKFREELLHLQKKYNDDARRLNTDLGHVDKLTQEQIRLVHAETAAKIKKLSADNNLDETRRAQLTSQLRKNELQEVKKIEQSKREEYKKTIDQLKKENASASKEFVNGFKAAALESQMDLTDWSQHGQNAAHDIQGTLTAGFVAMGNGSESAAGAMKKAFLSALGDRAIAEGSFMLLAGLFPPNPLELAAGGGLVALGSYLKSQSGGGGGGISASSGGGGGSSAFEGAQRANQDAQQAEVDRKSALSAQQSDLSSAQSAQASNDQNQISEMQASQATTAQRHVTVQFNGDFMSTDQTRQHFLEQMRKETDATDFKYVQVGNT